MMNELVGKVHVFEDGDSITIVQIKIRDGNIPWVTYAAQQGPGVARRLVMRIDEFVSTYGHLFGVKTEDIPWTEDE